jgi:hypothetical protein
LKKEDGIISFEALDAELKAGEAIPLARVVRGLSGIEFYDAQPNVVHTM